MADGLLEKTPVELRAMARALGIEQWDRMTGPLAREAIRTYEEEHQEGDAMHKRRRPFVEVEKGKDGQFRWHLKAANGEIISQGEAHPTRAGAEETDRAEGRDHRGLP